MYIDFPVIGESSKYSYSNAVLAVIEQDMLTQADVDQMKSSDDLNELIRYMSETIYAKYFDEKLSIDEIVEEETRRVREELFEILPEEMYSFFEVFYRRYDYNNLKMLFKSYFMDKPYPVADLSTTGNIYPDELVYFFEDDKIEELPFNFAFEEIKTAIKNSKELRMIDAVLDKAYYREYLAEAEKLKDDFFLNFVKAQIDLKNILIFIRCTRSGISFEKFLLSGGNIALDVYDRYEEDGAEAVLTSPDFQDYAHVFKEGLVTLEETSSYSHMETEIRNHQIEVLAEVRDYLFTVRPFIAYLLAKEHEIHLVKKIYVYVKNRIEFGSERDLTYV